MNINVHFTYYTHCIIQGDKVLRHRDVAVKKVNRSEANNVVLDVAVFRSKDKPSKLYRKIM